MAAVNGPFPPEGDEAGAEASAGSAAKQKSGGLRSLSSFGSLPEAPFVRRRASLASSSRADSAAAMQRDPSGVAFKAVLEGAMHFDFTDIALVAPLATTMLGVVGVGGRDVHDVMSAAVLRFLRKFNHPREPDAASPDRAALEALRAELLSRVPVAEVGAAERWGFRGGHAVGAVQGAAAKEEREERRRGRGEEKEKNEPREPRKWTSSSSSSSSSNNAGDRSASDARPPGLTRGSGPGADRTGRAAAASEIAADANSDDADRGKGPGGGGGGGGAFGGLKLPPLPQLPKIALGGMGHPSRTHKGIRGGFKHKPKNKGLARFAQYRRSFDATHLPENWMELETIPGSPRRPGPVPEEEEPAPEGEDGSQRGGGAGDDDEGFSRDGLSRRDGGRDGNGASDGVESSANPNPNPSRSGIVSRASAGGEEKTFAGDSEASRAFAHEVKPRIVRWVKSHEWLPRGGASAPPRAFSASQRREMRWLIHECANLGAEITPSDFCAMFPSFDVDEIRRCAMEELTSDEAHPEPKPLVWLAQMVVDGDIPRRRKDGGNHLGLDDEHLERTYQLSPRSP